MVGQAHVAEEDLETEADKGARAGGAGRQEARRGRQDEPERLGHNRNPGGQPGWSRKLGRQQRQS